MLQMFAGNEATFAAIKNKACAFGHYQTIGERYTNPSLPKSDEEWFDDQMKRLQISSLHVHGTGAACSLTLDVWSDGFAGTPADYKEYYYGPIDLNDTSVDTRMVSSLDHPPSSSRITFLYRSLGKGWWLDYISYP